MHTRIDKSFVTAHGQAGFSIIELLVATAVGLTLVSGLALLFANSSRTGYELDKSVRQIENGRYAMEVLSEDVSLAGYYGELPPAGFTFQTADPCAATVVDTGWDNALLKLPVPLTGVGAAAVAGLGCVPNAKVGTVAFVVHRFDTATINASALAASSLYAQTSRCASDPIATKVVVSNNSAAFTLRDLDCLTLSQLRRYVTRIYYVASCNECGVDTTPTLKRVEVSGTSTSIAPLAEGVEEISFEYGFDTDGDGVPDVFLLALSGTAGALDNDWSNVVAVRLNMLTRTTEATPGFSDPKTYNLGLAGSRGPFTDNYKRRVYVTTVRLNNVAGPREK